MYTYDLRWMQNGEWYDYDDNLAPVLTDKAPPEARQSYNHYLEQLRERNNQKNVNPTH